VSGSAIETRSLRKQFGSKFAVEDLTLTVRRGEVFGFLGPNGAGKTTSVKLLLGLVQPSGGSGTVLGATIGDCRTRARIGFLPEHFQFHNTLTGRELLTMHGRLFGLVGPVLRSRVELLLARVDLIDAADRRLSTYSKGMVQRAGIAQALLNDPELVFLDEPTSGLDPLGRLLVRDIIDELRDRGAAVFLNSHLLGEVEATCDRVAFVKAGRVISELVLDESANANVVELRLGRADEDIMRGLTAFGTGIERDGAVFRLALATDAVLPELTRWLVSRDVPVYEVSCRGKSLEQRFVEVMGDDQRPG
jgi:ABC-2 type transport system ATP-binding protein